MSDEPGRLSREEQCVQQYREHLGWLLDCTHRTLPTVKFDKEHPQHLTAICLYATIFQSIGECYRLMDQAAVTVPGIMRSILESYADLCAVIQDPAYPKKMIATLYEEQRKHLEDMIKNAENPFHVETAGQIDPERKLAEVMAALEKMRGEHHHPLSVYDRFRAAGLLDLYRTIYWQLCLDAHNNVAALERRHLRRTGVDQFQVDVFAEVPAHSLGTYYDTLSALLIDSSRRLYGLLEFSAPDELNDRIHQFERFRPEAVKVLIT